jgi:hypothetical protein
MLTQWPHHAGGRHSAWLKAGGPPPAREFDRSLLLIDDRWETLIAKLSEVNPRLLATSASVFVSTEGFEGPYPTVSRHARAVAVLGLPGRRGRGADRDRLGGASASSIGATVVTSGRSSAWVSCTVSGPSCAGRGSGTGGSPLRSTSTTARRVCPASSGRRTGCPYSSRTDRMGALGSSRGRRFVLHLKVLDFARLHGRATAV